MFPPPRESSCLRMCPPPRESKLRRRFPPPKESRALASGEADEQRKREEIRGSVYLLTDFSLREKI